MIAREDPILAANLIETALSIYLRNKVHIYQVKLDNKNGQIARLGNLIKLKHLHFQKNNQTVRKIYKKD